MPGAQDPFLPLSSTSLPLLMVSPAKSWGGPPHPLSVFDPAFGLLQASCLSSWGAAAEGTRKGGKEAARPGQLAGPGEGVMKRAPTRGTVWTPASLIPRPASTSHREQAFPEGDGRLSPRLPRGRSWPCPPIDPPPPQTPRPARDAPRPRPSPSRRGGGQARRPAWRGPAGGPALTHERGAGRPGTRAVRGAPRAGRGRAQRRRGADAGRAPGERPERRGRGTLCG